MDEGLDPTAGPDGRWVGSGEERIYVQDVGSGPPLVLLHSFLCSLEMWREQVEPLARRYRVLNVDLPGHGRSAKLSRPLDLYALARRVVDALDELSVERAVWCGLSVGGMISLRAALERPEKVAALALLDTDAGAETLVKRLEYGAMAGGVRGLGMRPFVSLVARKMFGPTTHKNRPELVAEWKGRFARVHAPSCLLFVKALNRRDSLLSRLTEIRSPALVMVGEEDRALPPPRSARLHAALPGSTFVSVPGAGHLSPLEDPATVNRELLAFLDGLRAAGTI